MSDNESWEGWRIERDTKAKTRMTAALPIKSAPVETGFKVPVRVGQEVRYVPESQAISQKLERWTPINNLRLWHGGQGSIKQQNGQTEGVFNGNQNLNIREAVAPQNPTTTQMQKFFWDKVKASTRKSGAGKIAADPSQTNYRIESRGHNLRSRMKSVQEGLAQKRLVEQRLARGEGALTQQRANFEGYDTRHRLSYLSGLAEQLKKVKPQTTPASKREGTFG